MLLHVKLFESLDHISENGAHNQPVECGKDRKTGTEYLWFV